MTFPALPPLAVPRLTRSATLLIVIIGICALIESVLVAADLGLVGSVRWRNLVMEYGAFWAGLLRDWKPNYPAQPWLMFVTYSLLHTGPMHLIGNLLVLLWIGPALATRLGTIDFALLWATTACGGAVSFAVLSNSSAPMVGTSGAIFGLLGAVVALDYLDTGRIRPALNMTAALAVLNLAMLLLERGVLAWQTHLGGYLIGVLVILLLKGASPAGR